MLPQHADLHEDLLRVFYPLAARAVRRPVINGKEQGGEGSEVAR